MTADEIRREAEEQARREAEDHNPAVIRVDIALLAKVQDPVERDMGRQKILEKYKKYGLRASTVDAYLDTGCPEVEALPETLRTVDPWENPVDGETLFSDIYSEFSRYIALPKGGATVLSLWAFLTYGTCQ